MIGLIEVASHILCLWQAALLPPFEADVAAAAAVVMAGGRGGSHIVDKDKQLPSLLKSST